MQGKPWGRESLKFKVHYKNFFQPVMKLKEKVRYKGKVHRKYDAAKSPYKRVMESFHIPDEAKNDLKTIYNSLNPAQLKRSIDEKTGKLYKVYQEKNRSDEPAFSKKQTPRVEKESYIYYSAICPHSQDH